MEILTFICAICLLALSLIIVVKCYIFMGDVELWHAIALPILATAILVTSLTMIIHPPSNNRGKMLLQVTYDKGVPIDSTVIFK